MNTEIFWEIIDKSSIISNGSNSLQEKLLIDILADYPKEEIIDFEIVLRQLIDEADHYNVVAAEKIIQGWVSDDSYLYFRCWLIAQGKSVFYGSLQNPDLLANIITDATETSFEELLYIATEAFKLKTGKQEEDDSFPREVASEKDKALNYDMGGSGTKGEDWEVDDLPKLYPKLCARFPLMPDASKNPEAAFKALLASMNIDLDLSNNPEEALKAAIKKLEEGNNKG